MAPVPSLSPESSSILSNAGKTWEFLPNIMTWFAKVTTTGYAYSDLVIKTRQDKVNKAAKLQRAEEDAAKFMEELAKKRIGDGDKVGRRDRIEWYDG
jgi:hypothetical protein